ncbi:DUF1460 domain-containing protein [Solimicrobium silvestre]|uniref:Lipoprotein n=1 Tax=Solimicrobium silvestre TaxID=2099400 RepID=A0A2S9H1J7_9BURK|nr:DUF1460 domain-containing protein [Solimicrobium silvestre]PRC93852.1 hypothetical protein S2091_1461 [Solimicrobium silvestre]
MRRVSQLILISSISVGCAPGSGVDEVAQNDETESHQKAKINIDPRTLKKLNILLEERSLNAGISTGQMIDLLSGAFLETPYRANMLQGAVNTPEKLVIDFRGLDCFTYLDYVEALRKSTSQTEFVENVIQTRYVDGDINFLYRKHFFTDWAHREHKLADDITALVSPDIVRVEKYLNKKVDGETYLPGLPVVERSINYIPSEFINDKVISRLQTGDFIGIYTKLAGLDVTHVGFFIMTDNGPVLRNASSRKENEKVVDSPFMDYVAKTPGIIILRAKQ